MSDARDRIRLGTGGEGIERLEARLHGKAFAPHRHDSYAIGITVAGVQTFRFRGTQWHCLPGQCHILHPDELHDGGAGTSDAFGYRMLYIDPRLVQEALRGQPLPFVANPVVDAARLIGGDDFPLWDMDDAIDDVKRIDLTVAVVNLLARGVTGGNKVAEVATDGATRVGAGLLDLRALSRVRERIAASPAERHAMQEFEALSGLDRWTLARQFRAAFGTSPSRFRVQRQLDHARALIKQGRPLADAALEAGFADQSHLSRQFKSAYGLTPARWASAIR